MKKGAIGFMAAVMPTHAEVAAALQSNRTPHLAAHLRRLYDRVGEFQQRKFPTQPFDSKLTHLTREVEEWRADPHDLREAADCLILFLAAAHQQGFALEQIIAAAHAKVDKNNLRHWAPADAAGVHHHLEAAR